jgi:myo-inositol-1(or 4)-monophosphatase
MTLERARVAREIALGAGAILLDHFSHLDRLDVRMKGRRNPVTQADLEAEDFIKTELRRAFPEDSILTEERGAIGDAAGAPARWIVDPLDGTVNFAHGISLFSVAIACEQQGELRCGVIYAPALGEMFEATLRGGALRNGKPISVSTRSDLADALLGTGFAYTRNEVADNNVQHFNDFILKVRDLRRMGSAAYDMACVACGRLDGYWELHLSPWDMAAGALLVREAGGTVTDLAGGGDFMARGEIVATNGHLHDVVQRVLATGQA